MFRKNHCRLACVLLLPLSCYGQSNTSLSLKEALERSEAHHIRLKQYTFYQQQFNARTTQADISPKPVLSIEVENILGSGELQSFSKSETTLLLSRQLELGGKRIKRLENASAQNAKDEAAFLIARLDVLSETAARYYELMALSSTKDLVSRRIEQEKQALSIIHHRANQGAVTEVDVAKMTLHLAKSKAQLEEIKDLASTRRYELAALWQQLPDFVGVSEQLLLLPKIPSESALLKGLEQSPDSLLAKASEHLALQHAALTTSQGRADITLGGGLKYLAESGNAGFAVKVSMPLQFTPPNQGLIDEAKAESMRQSTLSEDRFIQVRLQGVQLRSRANQLTQQITRIQKELLPKAQHLLAVSQQYLEQGQLSVLEWVDAEDQVFVLEQAIIDKYLALHLQLLALERLLGQPLTSFGE